MYSRSGWGAKRSRSTACTIFLWRSKSETRRECIARTCDALTPHFSLYRLTHFRYQYAIAGLIQGASKPWALDVRHHGFEDDFTKGILRSSIRESNSLESFNRLSLKDNSAKNVLHGLSRDRFEPFAVPGPVGFLDYAHHMASLRFTRAHERTHANKHTSFLKVYMYTCVLNVHTNT